MVARALLTALVIAVALTGEAQALGLSVGTPPGSLSPFRPGATATATGTLVISSPLAAWTLQISDGTAGTPVPGHLQRSALCSQGVSSLAQPLSITSAALLGTSTSTGPQSLGSAPVTVSSGPATVATTVTTNYSQVIGGSEALVQGCAYTVTVTYTLS